MLHAEQPSSPGQEIAERARWTGPTLANGLLTPELVVFCESGVSVVMASVDSAGRPVVARGLGCRIDALGRVRVVFREPQNAGLKRAVAFGSAIAATFTKPYSHRSIQLKATRASLVDTAPMDGPTVLCQTRAFREELVQIGYTEDFAAAYTRFEPHELAALEFLPECAFVQTPGPSAGSALAP